MIVNDTIYISESQARIEGELGHNDDVIDY